MRGPIIAVSAFAVVAIAVGAIAFSSSDQDRFLATCEDHLRAGLKAPSTYKRISVDGPIRRDATAQEASAVTAGEREAYLDADAAATGNSRTFEMKRLGAISYYVTYDAANAYGTPIRGSVLCEQMVYGSQGIDPTRWIDVHFQ